jgi:beta-glucosidase
MNMREAITPELLAMARKADAVILCTGFDSETEGEGFDRSFILPKAQNSLIEQIAAVNPKTIVVLNSGGNVDMRSWLDRVPALLHAWYPGQEGATALAQIVFGEYSPSGKLPISFEQRWEDNPVHDSYYPAAGTKHVSYNEGVFVGYRNYDRAKVKPRFAFGFGLSYSTFDFSGLSATRESSDKGEFIRVSFTLKNTGARDGADVAQLYVGEVSPVVPRPLKELKGFIKVDLKPGESRPMSLLLDRRSFAYYDVNAKGWKVQPGRYSLCLGDSSQSCSLQQELVLTEADVHGLADPYAAH